MRTDYSGCCWERSAKLSSHPPPPTASFSHSRWGLHFPGLRAGFHSCTLPVLLTRGQTQAGSRNTKEARATQQRNHHPWLVKRTHTKYIIEIPCDFSAPVLRGKAVDSQSTQAEPQERTLFLPQPHSDVSSLSSKELSLG